MRRGSQRRWRSWKLREVPNIVWEYVGIFGDIVVPMALSELKKTFCLVMRRLFGVSLKLFLNQTSFYAASTLLYS